MKLPRTIYAFFDGVKDDEQYLRVEAKAENLIESVGQVRRVGVYTLQGMAEIGNETTVKAVPMKQNAE